MKILEHDIKNKIHFVGIGGIGMSGIAEVMHSFGYYVQGSDIVNNQNVKRLKKKGIKTFLGHSKKNIKNINILVISSAIKKNNPEIVHSKKNNIKIYKRSQILSLLMNFKESIAVSGTHGKTTTTSLISSILEYANFDPTTIIGGIVNAYKGTTRIGKSKWIVVEADESDGSLSTLFPKIGVITNINKEHMDFYKSVDKLQNYFLKFIKNISFDGLAVLCNDNSGVKKLIKKITNKNFITYGFFKDSDIQASNIFFNKTFSCFDVKIKKNFLFKKEIIKEIKLNMLGRHNILNCLAAISVAKILNIKTKKIKNAFKQFQGIQRRFTLVDTINGVKIYDDYAHHPEEIKSTLDLVKILKPKHTIVVFQPHRYSRFGFLYNNFKRILKNCDKLIVADVYPAGEKKVNYLSKEKFVKDINKIKKNLAIPLNKKSDLPKIIKDNTKFGDLVIFLGAGDISKWAYDLPLQIKRKK